MAFIRWRRESFALEYMTEMAPASGASDLRAGHTQRFVLDTTDGSWDSIEESRPTATTREFGVARVERRPTPGARVNARFLVVFVFPSACVFCAL